MNENNKSLFYKITLAVAWVSHQGEHISTYARASSILQKQAELPEALSKQKSSGN